MGGALHRSLEFLGVARLAEPRQLAAAQPGSPTALGAKIWLGTTVGVSFVPLAIET